MKNLFLNKDNTRLQSIDQKQPFLLKRSIISLLLLSSLLITSTVYSATTTTTGSGNWSSTTPNAPWPLGIPPLSINDVIIGNGFTLTVDGNKTCNSIGFTAPSTGTGLGTLTVNNTFILTVTASLSCPDLTAIIKSSGIYNVTGLGGINCSTFNCSNTSLPSKPISTTSAICSISNLTIAGNVNLYSTFNSSGSKYTNANLYIQSGTVNVIGGINTINSNAINTSVVDLVTSASNPTLNIGGATPFTISATGMSTLNLNGTGATVNYNSTSPQAVYNTSYTNLTLSGSGSKTFPSTALSISSNLTVSGTANVTMAGDLTVGGNVVINAGSTFNANSYTHNIAGNWSNSGTFAAGTSTIKLNGSVQQTIAGGSATTFNNLTINNTAGATVTSPTRITNAVSFGNVNNTALYSNGFITMASTATSTAYLADITNNGANSGNSINGNVVVERYIMSRRAYRFLTAPVNSTTSIKANWMENTNNTSPSVNNNPVAGYGTHITGIGGNTNGFDATGTNNTSLFTFNATTQLWSAVTNTNGTFTAGNGYRLLVRGSRSVDLFDNNAIASSTTLRATGTLATGSLIAAASGGTAGMPALSGTTGGYSFIANPYASPVNWVSILATATNVSSTIYIFDPTISGSSGRGGYAAYNGTLNVNNTAGSLIDNNIQSGQAFFVQTTAPNPSITFKESYKSSTFLPVFRTANDIPNVNIQLLLPSQVTGTGSADGSRVYFSDNFSNAVDREDSYKFTNLDENLAVVRDGKTLSIEGRKPIRGTDTITLKIWQLTQKSYSLKITLDKFDSNIQGFLEDKFLKINTPLSAVENMVPFTITADAASASADRFTIVFKASSTLPIALTGIKATEKNKGVEIEWTANTESNVDHYEVERAIDAVNFKTICKTKANNNQSAVSIYNAFDALAKNGDNFYRIRTMDKSGEVRMSETIKIHLAETNIKVLTNVIKGNHININFTNLAKANYTTTLFNNAGQIVYTGNILHEGGTSIHSLKIKTNVAAGLYQLVLSAGSSVKNIPVFIQ